MTIWRLVFLVVLFNRANKFALADPGGRTRRASPLRDPILLFRHTNLTKRSRLGSSRPPTGNPGSATDLSYLCCECEVAPFKWSTQPHQRMLLTSFKSIVFIITGSLCTKAESYNTVYCKERNANLPATVRQ